MFIGNREISKIYKGNQEVNKVYRGQEEVYSSLVYYPYYNLSVSNIIGMWSFNSSINPDYGSHTPTDFGSVTTIQSSVKKFSDYNNALKITGVAALGYGLRLSSNTNFVMSDGRAFEAWFYPIVDETTVVETGRLFTMGNRRDNICFMLDRYSTGLLYGRSNSSYIQLSSNNSLTPNQWHWLVVSRLGTELKIFIDGELWYLGANGINNNGYTSDGQYLHISCDYDTGYGSSPIYPGDSYWQDIIFHNNTPYHSYNSLVPPFMKGLDRIV